MCLTEVPPLEKKTSKNIGSLFYLFYSLYQKIRLDLYSTNDSVNPLLGIGLPQSLSSVSHPGIPPP